MSASSDKPRAEPFTIVVGVAFSPGSHYAVEEAAHIARPIPCCTVHVVHVVRPGLTEAEERNLADSLGVYLSEVIDSLSLDGHAVRLHVRAGRPGVEIAQLATDVGADVVVVGAHEHPHFDALMLGALAVRVMRLAPCPVLVARRPRLSDVRAVEIEPPCARCVEARRRTAGKEWWCDEHAARGLRPHVYSYRREHAFAEHDALATPSGVDF